VYAQDNQRGFTLAEYASVKTMTFKNIEKNTYVREKEFVFDRPDDKPFYDFNLNDGVDRKIFLYSIQEGSSSKNLGSLAVFSMKGKLTNLVIPNSLASKEVWTQYLEDLKNNSKTTDGFAICVAYMLSQLGSGAEKATAVEETKDPNDFCFPADIFVNLANGVEKNITEIKIGDTVAGLPNNEVTRIDFHQGFFKLHRILVRPNGQAWVSTHVKDGLIALEATENHPILTLTGKKQVKTLQKGDWLFVHDAVSGRFVTAEIVTLVPNARTVSQVFNLKTKSGMYEAESIVVFDKH
jgi:hypothetical protein